MTEAAISVRNLSKTYRLYGNPWKRLREKLPWVKEPLYREVWALRDIDLEVPKGKCVGIIGGNGAGKSTLLKILTGTTFPDTGSYTINGRVASLLELGAGFNQHFSGRENIFMNAALMGFSRKEAQAKYEEILAFSELRPFIHLPIRAYSSGMVCRLGFSVAVATEPDVLIIDEILAVGDMHFRRKCVDRIMRYKQEGKTILFCSHSLYDIRQICDNTLWLKEGRIAMFDDSQRVTNEYSIYENTLAADQDMPASVGVETTPNKVDTGEHARILSADLVDLKSGKPRHVFAPGDDVGVRVHVRNGTRYEPLHVAVVVTRKDGTHCIGGTTEFDGVLIEANEAIVTMKLPNVQLLSGEFGVPVWLLDSKGVHRFHEFSCRENLIIQHHGKELGMFLAAREWHVEVIEGPPATADTGGAGSSLQG